MSGTRTSESERRTRSARIDPKLRAWGWDIVPFDPARPISKYKHHATGATIGKCALYDERLGPAIPSAYLIRFRVKKDEIAPQFALRFLMSPVGQELLTGGSTAVAQLNVNATVISQFPVSLPPLAEQREIVRRVKQLFDFADGIEKRLGHATTAVERLTESVLTKAFAGELVATEAEIAAREGRQFEPASVLLDRCTRNDKCQSALATSEEPRAAARALPKAAYRKRRPLPRLNK